MLFACAWLLLCWRLSDVDHRWTRATDWTCAVVVLPARSGTGRNLERGNTTLHHRHREAAVCRMCSAGNYVRGTDLFLEKQVITG